MSNAIPDPARKARSKPAASTTSRVGPSSPPGYVLWEVNRDSQYSPPAQAAVPASSSGRVPVRGTILAAVAELTSSATVIGRNATPARSGE